VIHRANIDRVTALVELAASLGASRIEFAHVRYYGWASRNRTALMPTHDQVIRAMGEVERIRPRFASSLAIDLIVPDYYARRPKACMGGWARRSLNVTPSGRVLPCHAAETILSLQCWSVRDQPLQRIWREAPALQVFRGTEWMLEPCGSGALRESISAAIAARRSLSPVTPPRPILPASYRLITRSWRWWNRIPRRPIPVTAIAVSKRAPMLLPFQLTERRGRVAGIILIEQPPVVAF
jgi:MoaA/NifB/PqqE/SkfB family radical SAM enzyme